MTLGGTSFIILELPTGETIVFVSLARKTAAPGILLLAVLWILVCIPAVSESLQQEQNGGPSIDPGEPFIMGERLTFAIEWDAPWYFFIPDKGS